MPPRTAATLAHPRAQDGERVHVNIESPRRDAVADYLLDRHHDLALTPAVTHLLTVGAPLGILATGLLRPAGIRLAAILALLDSAPSGSRAATTQLLTHGTHDHGDTTAPSLGARFAKASIPLAAENQLAAEQLLGDVAHITTDSVISAALDQDAASTVVRTAMLGQRDPRSSTPALRPGSEQTIDVGGRRQGR